MQYQQGDYSVIAVIPIGPTGALATTSVPEPLREAFVGRTFTRQEMEGMGVQFVGDRALIEYEGQPYALDLTPRL